MADHGRDSAVGPTRLSDAYLKRWQRDGIERGRYGSITVSGAFLARLIEEILSARAAE